MHIIVGHGIAGTETELLIHAAKTVGVTNEHIIMYAGNVYFPKVLGKFDVQLFQPQVRGQGLHACVRIGHVASLAGLGRVHV
jgi:hypothetical protein